MSRAQELAVKSAGRPSGGGRRLPLAWVGVVPFLGYVGLFLLLPTAIVAVGAFSAADGFTFANFRELTQPFLVRAFFNSVILSA